jgi:periplasmic divalent cation tolerance protein
MDMSAFCIVQTSIDDAAKAEAMAAALVEQRLAACVQVAAVDSHYVWKGALNREQEFLLSAKTRRADFAAVAQAIRALHGYDLPEIVAVPILAGDAAYFEWVWQATERGQAG